MSSGRVQCFPPERGYLKPLRNGRVERPNRARTSALKCTLTSQTPRVPWCEELRRGVTSGGCRDVSQRRARGKRERRTHTNRCARERHEKKGDAFFNDGKVRGGNRRDATQRAQRVKELWWKRRVSQGAAEQYCRVVPPQICEACNRNMRTAGKASEQSVQAVTEIGRIASVVVRKRMVGAEET